MPSVIFSTPGLLDLRALTTMGISAKLGENPIGMFGTGLKYAIAVVLRDGGSIEAYIGRESTLKFFTKEESFRGKTFQFIYYQAELGAPVSLGITTELGKGWEPWMAVRELESNTRDEGGSSWIEESERFAIAQEPNVTKLVVTCESFTQAFRNLHEVFLSSKPLARGTSAAAHAIPKEPCKTIYYRGVRCGTTDKPTLYAWNILSGQQLTEDRTFKYGWLAVDVIRQFVFSCDDREIIHKVLTAKDGFMEQAIDFNVGYSLESMSEAFKDEVMALGGRCNLSATVAVKKASGSLLWEEVPVEELDEYNRNAVDSAVAFLAKAGFDPSAYPIRIAKDLGGNVLGRAHEDSIWLSLRVVEMGRKQLISCLLEEFIHLDRGYSDNTYEMQSFLFDSIITLLARHVVKEVL